MTIGDYQYWAFLSYNHQDEQVVAKFHRKLEGFRIPARLVDQGRLASSRIYPVFRDREELSADSNLSQRITDALKNSKYLIVMCSAASSTSHWVNEEIRIFIELGRADQIICCIIDDACNIPAQLATSEPLAADLVLDGPTNARLKVIARLIDCNFDDLKQRDLHRSNRRLGMIAVVSVLGIVMTSALALYAFNAQATAERNQELATLHLNQAQGLVGFMVGDLRERLEPIGKLDVLDAVGDKVLSYYAELEDEDITSAMALTQVTALRQIGEVRVNQGRYAEGVEAFERAIIQIDRVSLSGVTDQDLLFERSQLNFWIADAQMRQLDMDAAEQSIMKYLQVAQTLHDQYPANPKYTMELAYAYNNLGAIAHRLGQQDRARDLFARTMEIEQSLTAQYPDDITYLSELANTMSWIASVDSTSGRLKDSRALFEQELELRRQICDTNDEPRQRILYARSYRWLGWNISQLGDAKSALEVHRSAREIYEQLIAFDPDNFDWQKEYYWLLLQAAKDQVKLGQLSAARHDLDLLGNMLAKVADGEQDVEIARLKSVFASTNARYYLANNELAAASRAAAEGVREIESYVKPEAIRSTVAFAEAAYLLSEASPASRGIIDQYLSIIATQAAEVAEIDSYLMMLAYNAGRYAQARELADSWVGTQFTVQQFVPGSQVELWLQGIGVQKSSGL
jgi:tetratricopeptide (TPR) repeat protein